MRLFVEPLVKFRGGLQCDATYDEYAVDDGGEYLTTFGRDRYRARRHAEATGGRLIVRTAFLTEWRGVDPDSIPRIASRAPRHAHKTAPAKAHTYGGDCGCKPVYDVAKDRWAHRGPLPHVFEPTDGDAVTAEGWPTEDHR